MQQLLDMSRSKKKVVFLVADTAIMFVSLYLAVALRYGNLYPFEMLQRSFNLLAIMSLVGPLIIVFSGLPRIKLHAIESNATMRIALTAAALATAAIVVSYLLKLAGPRSVPLIFGAVFFLLALSMRVFGLHALRYLSQRKGAGLPVIIYGAGAAGIQLASALRQSIEARPVLFVDDNPNLINTMISGLQVRSPADLPQLIKSYAAARVLLAIPSLVGQRRNELLTKLTRLPVEVQVLPSYIDLMSGRSIETSLRSVQPDEMLNREMVDLHTPEIVAAYSGRTVMVTGAGGSIGSELCRQLMHCRPSRVVLFEQSEYALYSIEREIAPIAHELDVPLIACLGSVTNRACVERIIKSAGVEIILHAAAYKHVPLVECNEIEGATNNVVGTEVIANVAQTLGIERFILVSTDKAVRPTNIMGATKRMAELIVQDIQTRAEGTKFAMVRFGNVLGSSGSFLPLFQKQIAEGGPVTVTHPDVTRFFMTIPEAAKLVLLAGAYAKGGDVFVLDMGKPQKIRDIAKRMIELSGRSVKDPETGKGDVEITFTGLRPGEKLYEELLMTDQLASTPHPKIMRAKETPLSQIQVASLLRDTRGAIASGDVLALRRTIEAWVEGYHRQDSRSVSA